MKETLLPAKLNTGTSHSRYEYLVVSVSGGEPLSPAYQRVREHAEYGKWELERTRLYIGGARKYWLRRRVLRVERTLEIY